MYNGKKNALDYANETLEIYKRKSPYNPDNGFSVGLDVWQQKYAEAEINVKLDTILERLPYLPFGNDESLVEA